MQARTDKGRTDPPRGIAAADLEKLIGNTARFCSWDAANESVDEATDHWPFLFSHPVLKTIPKKPKQ